MAQTTPTTADVSAPVATSANATSQPAPMADQTVKMNPFDVAGGKSNGYNVSSATSATRTNTALIDIPQTVDVVTNQFWLDTSATTFNESFKYVANVYTRNEAAGDGDTINIRGFENSGSIAVDGVLVAGQAYKRDLIGYDRLEVVKGPPSAVQGRAGGTGFFNFILKKPTLGSDFTDLKYTAGTDDFGDNDSRGEVDLNRTFGPNNSMGFRLAAAWERSDYYVKFQNTALLAIYPSFAWNPTSNTQIVWTNEILKSDTPSREDGHGFALYPHKLRLLSPQFGVASDPITALNLPYNFSSDGPGDNDYETVLNSTIFVTHEFNEHISYRQAFNYRFNNVDSQTWTDQTDLTLIQPYTYDRYMVENHTLTIQGDLIGNYQWKNWVNTSTLIGYNYKDNPEETSTFAGVPNAPFTTVNLAALAATGDSASYFFGRTVNASRTVYNSVKNFNFGVYAEEDLGFLHDRIILNGSVRRDHDHNETDSRLTNVQTAGPNTQLTSYRYGVTVKVTPHLALYGVESLQNNPPVTYQLYPGLLAGDPRNSLYFSTSPYTKLYEGGIKGELFNGRLTFSADHWEMQNVGAVVNIVAATISQGQLINGGHNVEEQGAESHGYEFEAYGAVTDRLSLVANYTRMYTSQQNPNDLANPGDEIAIRFAPIWNVNVFAKYSFRNANDDGLELKAGVNAIGPFWTQLETEAYIPHSQHNYDAGFDYKWHHYLLNFMVTNLDNSPFLITRDQPPRSYKGTIEYRF